MVKIASSISEGVLLVFGAVSARKGQSLAVRSFLFGVFVRRHHSGHGRKWRILVYDKNTSQSDLYAYAEV